MITTNTNNTKRKSTLIITIVALATMFFALPFSSTAQTIFTSGFEPAHAVLTYNSTTNTADRINSLARAGGVWRGGFTANGTYDGCAITPLLNFTAGNTYTINVYSRAMDCTGRLRIFKNLTATNVAMKASAGGDILLNPAGNNVLSTAYVLYTVSWVAAVTESKYVGFQMMGTGGGGCGAINLGIDDITIVQSVAPPPCVASGNNFCSGAWAPTLNGQCCASTLSGATDDWASWVGCQSGNNHPEVWYSGTPAAGQNQLTFNVSNLGAGFGGNVELIVTSSSGPCAGLAMAGSFCGPAPLSYSLIVVPGVTYYWTVSSSAASNGATSTFDICVTQGIYVDNSACNLGDAINATPAPIVNANFPNGTYPPATTVQFDYTITGWAIGASCNWLAGIVPSWGTGWDPASFVRVINPVPAAGDLSDSWGWWTAPITHNTTGANINPTGGWFYCNNRPTACVLNTSLSWGDGCIGDAWGMGGTACNSGCDAVAYAALNWNVRFTLTTRATAAACVAASSDLSVNVKTYADGEIGSWTSIGCMADLAATNGPVTACCIDNTTPLTWTGLTTPWANTDNWGSCILPTCTNDVVVPVSASNATITTAVSCRNITIDAGATLVINAGGTLSICGNFINNGTVTCAAGSTVIFVGTAAQSISGVHPGTTMRYRIVL